ncbi:MAG TPA: SAM-dependent chlorinase/fluorinase [Alphaproteobacteria bacterium]
MIVLFTDFGIAGPYIGQVKAVLHREAPNVPVIDLCADAPTCDPKASAYLLAALAAWFPAGATFVAVVDPGVGGPRAPLALEADGRSFVGPDNGLFELVMRRATRLHAQEIAWRPPALSHSFHGRDLFAPIAARIAARTLSPDMLKPAEPTRMPEWPDDLAEIVYIDHYGNAMTGIRANRLPATARLVIGGRTLPHARTFVDVEAGRAFWYENSNGLVEIAVNQGRADTTLGLAIGTPVSIRT